MPRLANTAGFLDAHATVGFAFLLFASGHWHRTHCWGDVWVPSLAQQGWRPYMVGHWIYTNDYGWYWVSGECEAGWGWIVYHYGRWLLDPDLGWVWIRGDKWAPAWVMWRRSHNYIGWAPLPPDRLITEYRDHSRIWTFVHAPDLAAPVTSPITLPPQDEERQLRETIVINRTVVMHDRESDFAVNPGIAPTVVTAISGRPIHTYEVHPPILAGTTPVPRAIEIRLQDLQLAKPPRLRMTLRRTRPTIQAEKITPSLMPFA